MNLKKLKEFITAMLFGGFQRLKPERIQGQSAVPGEEAATADDDATADPETDPAADVKADPEASPTDG